MMFSTLNTLFFPACALGAAGVFCMLPLPSSLVAAGPVVIFPLYQKLLTMPLAMMASSHSHCRYMQLIWIPEEARSQEPLAPAE